MVMGLQVKYHSSGNTDARNILDALASDAVEERATTITDENILLYSLHRHIFLRTLSVSAITEGISTDMERNSSSSKITPLYQAVERL